jgi:signal transduction histidine kinase
LARHLDVLGLSVAVLSVAAVLVVGLVSIYAAVEDTGWVDHTHLVIESIADLRNALTDATNSRRGFSLTGDSSHVADYERASDRAETAEAHIRSLTIDNGLQQQRLDELEPRVTARLARLAAAIDYRRIHGFEPDREGTETREGMVSYADLTGRLASLELEERRLLALREGRASRASTQTEIVEIFGVGLSLSIAILVVVRLRRENRRHRKSERALRKSEHAVSSLNKDLEGRVRERTADLARANQELESFSYSVVHDLRAPLRGMSGFAEILLGEKTDMLDDYAKECLQEIRQNASKMAVLIDALVAMSRLTRSAINREHVDLSTLVRQVTARLAGREPLVLSIAENLSVQTDRRLTETLVEILIGNSLKFASSTSSRHIEFGMTDTDGTRVWFVRDNGAGFDMAYAAKLFIPFGRLHTTAEFPGVGIGLAMAKRIVERHGGRIWAESHLGQGASFYFTLLPNPARSTNVQNDTFG